MARNWTGKWAGGRTRAGKDGKTVWVIEAMRLGATYSISLPVHSERDAMAELALFERDPVAYAAAKSQPVVRDGPGDGPALTVATMIEFLRARETANEEQAPLSKAHLWDLTHYLGNWLKPIGGKDLRKVTLAEYQRHLATLGQKRKHIVALRSFTKWMRSQGRLSSAQDASRDLTVPQPKARRAQVTLGYSMEDFEKLYANVKARPERWANSTHKGAAPITESDLRDAQTVRDVLTLRALCGMHYSEIERVAKGAWKVNVLEGQGDIAGTVTFIHKKGTPHPQSLSQRALEAVIRLQARAYVPDKKFIHRLMDEACERAGLPKMRPGELRHSFVTWAKTHGVLVKPVQGAGVAIDEIARIVGHTSSKTTSTFYDNTQVPPLILLPLTLKNEEDPA